MNPVKNNLLLLILCVAALFSCGRDFVFEENRVIDKGIWNTANKISFTASIADTSLRYSVYLNIRNSLEYPYSNLYLFMDTRFPDGRIARDTIDCTLADYDGRWLGSGVGSVKYNRFLFQKGVRFQQKGNYRFDFQQAMRVNALSGIQDLGIRIEKEAAR
jgi:gliding motility-associated lipoprotein GldH